MRVERKKMVEKLEERYIRSIMRLDSRTPGGYMVREELQRGKLKGKAGTRA